MRRLLIILAFLLLAEPAMAAFTLGNHGSLVTNNIVSATLNVNTTGAAAVVFQIVYYRDPVNQNSCVNGSNQRVPIRPRDTLNSDDSWAALGEVVESTLGLSMSTWIGSGSSFNFGNDTFRIADTMYNCYVSFSVSAWNSSAASATPGIPQVGLPQTNTVNPAPSIQAGANNGGELVLTFLGSALGNCSGSCGYAADSGFTLLEAMNETGSSQGGAMAYRIAAPATNPTWSWARPPGVAVAMNVTLREVFATAGTLNVVAATTCELLEINQDLSYLADGGTLNVPAGSCTWPSTLTIARSVNILSPSAGSNTTRATQITLGDPNAGLKIIPTANNSTFKVDGFSFDGQDQTATLLWVSGGGKVNLIITHNTFKNGSPTGNGLTAGGAILIQGNEARGVIGNNVFDRTNMLAQFYGVNYPSPYWTPGVQPTLVYGGSDQLFFETNTIKYSSSFASGSGAYAWIETAQGGRAVVRFNQYDFSNVNAIWDIWDQHGWQSWLPYNWPTPCNTASSPVGCIGQTGTTLYENYDNRIVSGQQTGRLTVHRGSKGIFFDNTYQSSNNASITAVNFLNQQYAGGCSAAMLGMQGLPQTLPFDFIPEINDTYYFHNIAGPGGSLEREMPAYYAVGTAGELFQPNADGGGPNAPCGPVENGGPPTGLNAYPRGYWNYNASFNGATGVGRGPGSPATAGTYPNAPNCTMGVGWWRTDAGNWRTDGGHVANKDGEFWKCVSTNTWQLYYTPYTYPHPLVTTTAPPPTTLTVGNYASTQSYAALHVPSIALDTTGADAVLMVISEGGCDPATTGSSLYLRPGDDLNPNSMWRRVAVVGGPEPALQTAIWVISGAAMQTGANVTFQTRNDLALSRPCNASFVVAVLHSPNMLPGNILVNVQTDNDTGTTLMTLSPGPLGGGLVLSVLGTDIGDCGGSCGFAINSGFQILATRDQGAFNKGLGLAYRTNVPEGTDPQWSWTYNSGGSNQAQGINASLQERVFPSDTPTITTNTLPNATVGVPYSYTLVATGGGPPYTWAVASGSLPAGLGLAASGSIVGTPTTSGTAYFTVNATDAVGQAVSQALSLIVDNAPTLPITITTTSPLPAAVVNATYHYELTASGGITPYTWTIASGVLPAGLSLSTAGVISGTPSATVTESFTVHVSDSASPADTTSASLSLTVNPAPVTLSITSVSPLPSGTVGTPYSYTFGAAGGTGPYTWALTSGTLPTGLTLSTAGVLSGSAITPTGKPLPRGSTNFTVTVTDSVSAAASKAFDLTMNDTPPLIITPPGTIPPLTVGTPFNLALTATGGLPPYTWSIDPDTPDLLPPGLTLLSNGAISGTPTLSGLFHVVVDVTDSLGRVMTIALSFGVNDVTALTITTPPTLPSAPVGAPYSVALTASGGTPPYSWAVASGVLPLGISLSPAGVLSGTPSAPMTATFTVTVTDSALHTGSKTFTLNVINVTTLTILTNSPLPTATAGIAYSQTFRAAGGVPPYTWSVTSVLPMVPGLTLSANGVLSGTPTTATTTSFGAQVTDSIGNTASTLVVITIDPATPVITTTSLPNATLAAPYSQALAAVGGVGPYNWSVSAGALPAGLTLSPSGILSGTPTATTPTTGPVRTSRRPTRATTNFTVTAADTIAQTAVQALALTVDVTSATTAYGRAANWCMDGNFTVTINQGNGVSTNRFMRSFPSCTVTVFNAGTNVQATIYSDANRTPRANPFTAAQSGQWFFYADASASYDVRMSGGGIPAPFTLGDVRPGGAPGPAGPAGPPGVAADVYLVSQQPGADCGAQINNAYDSIPANGAGEIWVDASCNFSTPIVFGTPNKTAMLKGFGNATTLAYTGTSGIALTLNNGTTFDFTSTVRDLTLSGPGATSSTIGIMIGGTNGCVGCSLEHVKVQGFGTGIQTSNNTWTTQVSQSMIRANGTNLMMPSGTSLAGENIFFNHDVFADAPAPHTNSVWVQGGGQEVVFEACSFDQAQVRIGNGAVSAAQVVIHGSHFENPNTGQPGAVDYTYLTVDNNNGNYLRLTDSYMLQDRTVGGHYANFMTLQGGVVVITGFGMYTPLLSTVDAVAVLSNAVNVNLFAFNDLSGNVGTLFGGTTTGYISSFPGVDTAQHVGFNALLKAGDTAGGASFDVTGDIRSSQQLASIVPTGTPPIVVNSTTPVANLFGNILLYSNTGVQVPFTTHAVQGADQIIGPGGEIQVNLSGAAVYSNSSSYSCALTDTLGANPVFVNYISGSAFLIRGNVGDHVSYVCVGF